MNINNLSQVKHRMTNTFASENSYARSRAFSNKIYKFWNLFHIFFMLFLIIYLYLTLMKNHIIIFVNLKQNTLLFFFKFVSKIFALLLFVVIHLLHLSFISVICNYSFLVAIYQLIQMIYPFIHKNFLLSFHAF